ncbi:Glyoxalase I [Trema orientale]|uniref:lactoylglutathione lyase n=1 Tax=Trema orientale TaxID=63057 RepID=A0A2P5F2D6_TREOI|nr:Glyoxalase I [Trema orientale]
MFLSLVGLSMEARTTPGEDLSEWVRKDNRRFLRAIIRVGNLDRTIDFYTECLGMKVLRRVDFPENRYSVAVVGFGPEDSHFVIEMRYHYGVDTYEIGTGFGEFGIATQDVYGIVEKVRAKGGIVTREPGPIAGGGTTVFAFVLDPDGYPIEIIDRPPTPEPLCQIKLLVTDLDRAINFYQKALGMNLLLPKFDVTADKYTIAMVGYGSNLTQTTVVELKSDFNVTEYTKGNGYEQLVIGTDDVYKSAEAVKIAAQELGGKIIRPPGPIPKINAKITAFLDPEGWETVLVDNEDYLKELQKKE